MFISRSHDGNYYIAERSRRGYHRLLWSVVAVDPNTLVLPVEARDVPYRIRRQAYRVLDQQRGSYGE